MTGKDTLAVLSICESLKKATPTQKEYMMGFAEGMAYANEKASESREDVPESEKQ